jgi:predicted RNA-binding protein YlxR (DUF448 family)
MAKWQQRRKHVPRRTCVSCGAARAKRELVRVVRTPEGEVLVDETGKLNGRGAYLCRQKPCWDEALATGQLGRSLKVGLRGETEEALRRYAEDLPPSIDAAGMRSAELKG